MRAHVDHCPLASLRAPLVIVERSMPVAGQHGNFGAEVPCPTLIGLKSGSTRVYGQSWMLIRAKARLTKPA